MEVAAVVQPGERVEIGLVARLAEAARVLDRRAGALAPAPRSREQAVVEASARAREHAEQAERLELARDRDREAGRGSARLGVRGRSTASPESSEQRPDLRPGGTRPTENCSASAAGIPSGRAPARRPARRRDERRVDAGKAPAASSVRFSTSSRSIVPASSPSRLRRLSSCVRSSARSARGPSSPSAQLSSSTTRANASPDGRAAPGESRRARATGT